MRKTLLAAMTTTMLAIGLLVPPAAEAASNDYVVKGHPVSAQPGIAEVNYLCYQGAPEGSATRLERDGGTVGSSALGWQKSPAGSTIGPRVTLAGDPWQLSMFKVDVLAPSGTTGWVHVYFEDNGDGDDLVQNDGWAEVTIPASGSWQTLNVTNWVFTWDWWINGVYQGQTEDTVQDFAGASGAIAQATFDVVLGCNGQPFYLDALAVRHSVNQVSYDLEKAVVVCHPGHVTPECPDQGHLMAHMEWSTDGTTVQAGSSVTIRYGQSLWMLGHSHVHFQDGRNEWYSGVGKLYQTPAKGTQTIALNGAFSPSQYAALRVAPKRNTIYQFAVDAHAPHPATSSAPVTVWVQSKVKAKVLDKRLIQGQKLVVKGRILPAAKRVRVTLERKAGGKWKNLGSSRTKKAGWFDIATTARQPGRWKVRVTVATTGANLGTTTKSATVVVEKYVPPRKNQPPPPPPVDHTPEVTTPVTTQQPTQVSTSAPKPPPRPTSTGRIAVAGSVPDGSAKGEATTKP
jgi:hypothetical protein